MLPEWHPHRRLLGGRLTGPCSRRAAAHSESSVLRAAAEGQGVSGRDDWWPITELKQLYLLAATALLAWGVVRVIDRGDGGGGDVAHFASLI